MGMGINDRLREHQAALGTSQSGHLVAHCARCGCDPLFHHTSVLGTYSGRVAREVVEAYPIHKAGSRCISAPSLAVLGEEIPFLDDQRF